MSAVWSASRAAVRRRHLQTVVIGLVVTATTATLLLGLALLHAASGPFDRAFAGQRGAHAVASFDLDRVGTGELAAAGRASGAGTAGPFEVAALEFDEDWLWNPPGTLVVAGRADPGGAVDRVRMVAGRWARPRARSSSTGTSTAPPARNCSVRASRPPVPRRSRSSASPRA
ncbi:hypothetical protein ACFVDU_31700 [Streptomyces albidoflavus]